MPPNTVSVARPTKWGNPFRVGDDLNAAGAVLAFRIRELHLRDMEPVRHAREMAKLRGKNLACWCPIGAPCHADVLLELANAGWPA